MKGRLVLNLVSSFFYKLCARHCPATVARPQGKSVNRYSSFNHDKFNIIFTSSLFNHDKFNILFLRLRYSIMINLIDYFYVFVIQS